MKKLIALLAVIGFMPSAYAADGADASHSGEFRLQYKNMMNADGNDNGATSDSTDQTWHQRLRWNTSVRAGEKMTVNFGIIHNSDWGMNLDQTPDDKVAGAYTASPNNTLYVNEAGMTWMISDAWTLKFGRGAYTLADGRLVSAEDYENTPNAFDGAAMMWDQDIARMSFFAARAADFTKVGAPAVAPNTSAQIYGFAADFKSLPDFMKMANIHVVKVDGDIVPTAFDKEDRMLMGFVVTGESMGLDWRANYISLSGETVDDTTFVKTDLAASMYDLEFGYAMPEMMNSRFHFGYHSDTGKSATATDNETYNGFFYDEHNNAGLMDIFGWGNLTYMRVGAKMVPMEDLTVGLEYLMFTQTEKTGTITNQANGANWGTADNTKDELGTEIDLTVSKKYTNNFSIMARLGMFSPGDEFKVTGQEDAYNQLYVESKLTF